MKRTCQKLRGHVVENAMSPQSLAKESIHTPACVEARLDPDLQRIVDAWPTLPDVLRAGILAMIDAVSTPPAPCEWTPETIANLQKIIGDTPDSRAE